MEGLRVNWEFIGPLGSGGQSEVSLVRSPILFLSELYQPRQ